MATPLVTVLIPAFNAAATIRRALDSALAQTYRQLEIIVVDDGSKDGTSEIVLAYDDSRIRLVRLPSNRGESGAMNAGIAAAKGDLVAFLDADDEWLPAKLAIQVNAMRDRPNAAMVSCGCRFVDRQGDVLRDEAGVPSPPLKGSEVWRSLLAETLIAKPSVVARTAALRAVGSFNTDLVIGADQDMWIRLGIIGDIEFVDDILTIVHDTAGSLTKVHASKIDTYMLPMIKQHIDQQRHLLSRHEIRHILGMRYASVGRNLYTAGSLPRGLSLILRAMLRGYRIRENLWYLATASPPARMAKQLLRRRGSGARRQSGETPIHT
jgi:glycosyltransferase involved in cell wall biosynthesis